MAEPSHDSLAPAGLGLEMLSPLRRALKTVVINPFANYVPAGLIKAMLRFGKSELAQANWKDPGGWRSMVVSYSGKCPQIADKILVNGGTMPMALRNRKRLGAHLIARLIDSAPVSNGQKVHVLCLGAGPGQIILEALAQARREAHATLVDLSADAFEYGMSLARQRGLDSRVRYIQADVRDLPKYLDRPPHVVKMMGILEYLTDEQICQIAGAAAGIMPDSTGIVFNSLSMAHGTDRFFRRVFGLHMTYRSPEHVQRLMAQAGFGQFTVYPEPLGVFHVIVGRKSGGPGAGGAGRPDLT